MRIISLRNVILPEISLLTIVLIALRPRREKARLLQLRVHTKEPLVTRRKDRACY